MHLTAQDHTGSGSENYVDLAQMVRTALPGSLAPAPRASPLRSSLQLFRRHMLEP